VQVTLIVNPIASSVTRRARVVIQKAISADHQVTVEETTRKGQAIRLAHSAVRAGAEAVIALGGDGTINEVANGVLGKRCLVAPLPGGSTNVFARAIGYPNDAVEATGLLLEALAARSVTPASVGLANGRAFLFHVGAGFDAAVVARVEKRGPLKRYVGHPLFVASTLATWYRGVDRRRPWFRVETSHGDQVEGAMAAVALNTAPYTYLGSHPLDLAPEASLSRPLTVLALTSLSPTMLPALLRTAFGPGGLPDRSRTRHWPDVASARIVGHRPFPYQLDGELMNPVEQLELVHRPDAIQLLTPPGDGDGG
jgi:diacylglycerol kinase family enzyme